MLEFDQYSLYNKNRKENEFDTRSSQMRSKTTQRIFIPSLIFFLMSFSCAITAFCQPENYYYASGKKIPLEIAADYLAARIETGIRTKKGCSKIKSLILKRVTHTHENNAIASLHRS